MAQNITVLVIDELGETIAESKVNVAPLIAYLWANTSKDEYPWLLTIDEYGDTYINKLQKDYYVTELKSVAHKFDGEIATIAKGLIEVIESLDTHQYVKFLGD